MVVKVSKPELNLREKISELDKPSGVAGEAMLRAETPQEQFNLIGAGRRNLIINGDFRVAQRATTYTKTASSWNVYGSVDRWGIYYQNMVVAQNSGVINGSYQYYVSVGNTGAAPDNHFIYQKIESGSRIVSGKPITISFMAKSANSTELRLRGRFMDSATTSGSVNSGQKTFNLTPEWQSFDWTFTPVDTSANLTRDFLIIVDTEITNDTVSDIYDLTNFQIELGKVATPFEHRSYGEELALCQRYCYVIGHPSQVIYLGTGSMYTTTAVNLSVPLPVQLRHNSPSFTRVANGTGNWLNVYVGATGTVSNAAPLQGDYTQSNMRIYIPGAHSGSSPSAAGAGVWSMVLAGAQLIIHAEL